MIDAQVALSAAAMPDAYRYHPAGAVIQLREAVVADVIPDLAQHNQLLAARCAWLDERERLIDGRQRELDQRERDADQREIDAELIRSQKSM